MLKKIIILILICLSSFLFPFNGIAHSGSWDESRNFTISADSIPVYPSPDKDSHPELILYRGMDLKPLESVIKEGFSWFKINKKFWIPAIEPEGKVNLVSEENSDSPKIIDMYGILDLPHRFAVKIVKLPGAKGTLETYEKKGDKYVFRYSYGLTYRKEGPKEKYGDLKSPGGNVVRYIYRTTESSMNGWDKEGKRFGVFKVSYPMPHDALPYLMDGKMSIEEYNKIPTINYQGSGDNKRLYPHPHSSLGADILIHTKRWGSAGCFNIDNEEMSFLYNEDLVTENDKEIIPLVIYDEDTVAPPEGQLF